MSSVLVYLDGVLRKSHDGSPISEGMTLYKSLADRIRVVVIADDKDKTEIWFKQNGLIHKVDDIVDVDTKGDPNKDLRRAEYCRSQGKVEFVVTADLDLARELMNSGFTVLMFLQPKYIRPEFRPDTRAGVRSWESILEAVDRQQELYSEDPRRPQDVYLEGEVL